MNTHFRTNGVATEGLCVVRSCEVSEFTTSPMMTSASASSSSAAAAAHDFTINENNTKTVDEPPNKYEMAQKHVLTLFTLLLVQ